MLISNRLKSDPRRHAGGDATGCASVLRRCGCSLRERALMKVGRKLMPTPKAPALREQVRVAAMQGSQSLYDAGRAVAGVTAAQANADAVRRVYERHVRSALRDVEDALTAWSSERRRQAALQKAVLDSQQALEQTTRRYAGGLSA